MSINLYRSNRFVKIVKFGAVILSLLVATLACYTTPADVVPDDPPPVVQPPVQPAEQNEVVAGEVVGGWYGPACDEAEGTYNFRWSVDLMKNPQTGQLKGTVKFHDCPGGGRVLYTVVGNNPTGGVYTLTGQKMDGGGDLLSSAPETSTFTFDSSKGQISPNLAP